MRMFQPTFRVLLALVIGVWSPILCCCASASEGIVAGSETAAVGRESDSSIDLPPCHAPLGETDSDNSSHQEYPVGPASRGHCDESGSDQKPGGDCECDTHLQSATIDHETLTLPAVSGSDLLPPLALLPDFLGPEFSDFKAPLRLQPARSPASDGSGGTLRAQHILLTV